MVDRFSRAADFALSVGFLEVSFFPSFLRRFPAEEYYHDRISYFERTLDGDDGY